MWYPRCSASLRTQTRPATEFVSGEEGLRPKSYFFEFSFLEYAFTDTLKYEEALGPLCEGRWRSGRFVVLAFHGRAVHQMLSLCFLAQCTRRGGGYGHDVLTPSREVRRAPPQSLSVHRVLLQDGFEVLLFKVFPNLTKHWGNSSGYWGPRGRLVPVRRSRHCQLA